LIARPGSPPRPASRPKWRFTPELFVAWALLSVAAVLGTSWLLEPIAPAAASPGAARYFSLARGVLAAFIVMSLAVVVIARRTREAEASERTLRALLEAARDGILMTDPEGRLVMVNGQVEAMFGYRREDLLGRSLEILVPEGLRELRDASRKGASTDAGSHSKGVMLEVVGRRKDGSALALELSLSPLETAAGPVMLSVLRDMTDRKHMEEALQQAAEEYRSIFENLTEGIVQISPHGQLLTVNRTLARMLGYESPEDLLAHSGSAELPLFVDPEGISSLLQLLVQRGEVREHEAELHHRDGSTMWVALSLRVVRDPAGTLLHYEGTAADVTERRSAQAALRESQRSLANLLRNLPGVAYRRRNDPAWTAEFLSEGCFELLGYHPTQLIGNWKASYVQLIHPEDRQPVWEAIQAAVREERPFQLVYRVRTAGGQEKWVWEQGRALGAPDGRPEVLEGFVTDVTERKRAEEAVHVSEAKYRSLIENLEQGVFLKDSHLRFVAANRRFCQSLGCAEADIVSKTDFDFVSSERAEKYRAEDLSVLRQGNRLEVEEQLPAGASTPPRTVRVVKTPARDSQGRVEGVLGIVWDVTEQRALEGQLRQSQKMEAVGRLAGGVAHDFNNLLTVITGYSEMLLGSIPTQDPAHGLIEQIRKAGERAASLTRQLLTFSRKQVVAPRVLDLNCVVADTEKMLRRLIGEDIELATLLEPGLGPIEVDPGQMEQVILNLAVNARDAMPQGGQLTLATANVEVNGTGNGSDQEARPGPYVVLRVTDTGCGMDDQIKARIFEPFFTTKDEGKGTGLGLATVYGIVKQGGGYIEVDSEPGRGTEFQIYFPRLPGTAQQEPSDDTPVSGGARAETILLVEDDETVRGLVRVMLQRAGYRLLEAASGAAALQLSAEHAGPIHLLITDVVMPQMSGRVLAESLASLRPLMKVLYLSGYTDDAVVRHGVAGAGSSFLQKPFTNQVLTRKVRDLLDQPALSPAGG
jgi:PAS domain S-box-containing protein